MAAFGEGAYGAGNYGIGAFVRRVRLILRLPDRTVIATRPPRTVLVLRRRQGRRRR